MNTQTHPNTCIRARVCTPTDMPQLESPRVVNVHATSPTPARVDGLGLGLNKVADEHPFQQLWVWSTFLMRKTGAL